MTDLSLMMGKVTFDIQHKDMTGILRMSAVPISGIQRPKNKTKNQKKPNKQNKNNASERY